MIKIATQPSTYSEFCFPLKKLTTMTSKSASNHQNAKININQPLHYFTGKIRAYWKNLLFFSDARNVAFVDVHDLYVNGKHASYRDLAYLEELVQRNYSRGPELHAYVSDYCGEIDCPWPSELFGKMLWKAKCAWYGFIPHKIKYDVMNNIVYMPVSYYTGKIVKYCNDSILFGDSRNSVMVSLDNFYCFHGGDYYRNVHRDSPWLLDDAIHAYIIRLDVLSDKRLIGPLPCIPTWPQENIASDMWIAKFAWQGGIPEIVKDQVERFYTIRMNRWADIHGVPWIIEDYGEKDIDSSISSEELTRSEDKGNAQEVETVAHPSLVPTEQKPGLMKGSLLLADEDVGLMTSFADVIAFNKDSFYINGNKFIHNYDLSYFFKDHGVSLTAWVIPMEKPKLIFNVHVVWEAVCVWCGTPPKDLESIKKKYGCGKVCENSSETFTPVSFTHFIGKVKSLSFASGVLISRPGLEQQVKISFRRKAVYIHGRKFHSSCSLLDKQQLLESCVWSVLAYPLWTDATKDVPHYQALAMWHYDDQQCMMNTLHYAILDSEELAREIHNINVSETRKYAKEKERHGQRFSGWIAKVTENYGIIQSGSALVDAAYLYFKKEVLYVDGALLPKDVSLLSLKQGRQCNVEAKTIPPRNIGDYEVTLEATLVWIGRKPSLESSGEITPQSSPTHTTCKDHNDSGVGRNPSIAKTETESAIRPDEILHVVEGITMGNVLMADEQHGIIINSDAIIAFSSDILYVNGNKFKEKYSSLKDFCSDRKITVQATVLALREPKVVLNCYVMCEAICVWIGPEPSDLPAVSQKANACERQLKTVNTSKVSHKSLFFLMGCMTPLSKDITLLTCTIPKGTAKVILSKEKLFLNGVAIQQNDIFEQCKRKSQQWCVLAISVLPKNIDGHTVEYVAVAAWEVSHHHKMRTVLSSIVDSQSKIHGRELCAEYERASMKIIVNGVSDNMTDDITVALSQSLNLGEKREGDNSAQPRTSHLNDPSVIVSQVANSPSEVKGSNTFITDQNVSEQEFCGKHIAANIIKKTEKGGIAQWKSLQFKGYVFIEFSREILYLDMKLISNKWKVANVELRSCNFYVIPVPHHSVEECIVSLKATCGWIGKKPSHIPSPGSQLLPKIDLSSVHVCQEAEIQDTDDDLSDSEDDIDDDLSNDEVGDVEIPLKGFQNINNVINAGVRSRATLKSDLLQFETSPTEKTAGNITKGTQNLQLSKPICIKESKQPTPMESRDKIASKSEIIWENDDKRGFQTGTIIEVHSSVGQLQGADGSTHFFSRDNCFLYGVSLRNVELWHVLAQGGF